MRKVISGNKSWIAVVLVVVLTLSYSNAFAWSHHHGDRFYSHGGRWYRSGWFGFDVAVATLAIGAIVTGLPVGHRTIIVSGEPYYYYEGAYLRPCPAGYVVVPTPVVSPTVVVVPTTPVVVAAPAVTTPQSPGDEAVSINVPNANGSYTPVTLIKQGDGYIGPQGEYYEGHPTVNQLKALYGK